MANLLAASFVYFFLRKDFIESDYFSPNFSEKWITIALSDAVFYGLLYVFLWLIMFNENVQDTLDGT